MRFEIHYDFQVRREMSDAFREDPSGESAIPGEILKTAADAGQLVLESGGETCRAEETVTRVLSAFGARTPECFATPTGLMISFEDASGMHHGLVRRVKKRSMNLERISLTEKLVEALSPAGLTLAETELRLRAISDLKDYPRPVAIAAAAAGGGFFTFLFGGGPSDAVAAALISAVLQVSLAWLRKNRFLDFFTNILGGAITAALAIALEAAGIAASSDKAIIGAIMLLVPGVMIVNAIRDTIAGDLVAGLARAADAFIAAAGISIGAGISLTLIARLGSNA